MMDVFMSFFTGTFGVMAALGVVILVLCLIGGLIAFVMWCISLL